jgi:hypothetical protein
MLAGHDVTGRLSTTCLADEQQHERARIGDQHPARLPNGARAPAEGDKHDKDAENNDAGRQRLPGERGGHLRAERPAAGGDEDEREEDKDGVDADQRAQVPLVRERKIVAALDRCDGLDRRGRAVLGRLRWRRARGDRVEVASATEDVVGQVRQAAGRLYLDGFCVRECMRACLFAFGGQAYGEEHMVP